MKTQQLTQQFQTRFATVQPEPKSYSQGGYRGLGYNSSIGVTDVAKVIRTVVKAQHPSVKLSVRSSKYAGGQSLDINLMAAPFEVFNKPDASKLRGADLTWGEEQALARWEQIIRSGWTGGNQYYFEESIYLTDKAKEVFRLINEVCRYFNRDDSDTMTDYFDINFYYSMGIGKWDKPFIKTN